MSPPVISSSSPSSPLAAPRSRALTLLPSTHSIPSMPSAASTKRIPGTLTPVLLIISHDLDDLDTNRSYRRHLLRARASPATRDRIKDTSREGCRYFLENRYFRRMGVEFECKYAL